MRKLFIDEGVYTRNRNFRLIGSSKRTKFESGCGAWFQSHYPEFDFNNPKNFPNKALSYFESTLIEVLDDTGVSILPDSFFYFHPLTLDYVSSVQSSSIQSKVRTWVRFRIRGSY